MKILNNSSFTILSKTQDIIEQISIAARTCYQSQDNASTENDIKLVKNLLENQHYAMLEFADMTVQFNNCSRGLTHEIVRHRLCSFAQESTRYVDESEFNVVAPPHKNVNEKIITITLPEDIVNILVEDASLHSSMIGLNLGDSISYNQESFKKFLNENIKLSFSSYMKLNEQVYKSLRNAGWKAEDARQVLPTAVKSQIVVKANMREWRTIFIARCSKAAHWEIRKEMLNLLRWCKSNVPLLFDDFHIFEKEHFSFAHQIMSKRRIQEEINYFLEAGGDLNDLITRKL